MLYQINYPNIYGCFKFSLIKTTTESAMQWRKLVSLPSLLTVDSGWHYEYKLPSISMGSNYFWIRIWIWPSKHIYFRELLNYYTFYISYIEIIENIWWKGFIYDFKKCLTPLCITGSIVSLYASTSKKKTA